MIAEARRAAGDAAEPGFWGPDGRNARHAPAEVAVPGDAQQSP